MKRLTLFSWGYWGWGNATSQLIRSFDLAEQARGFEPPIFVDCRLRRQGRAKGFVGDAFKNLVGPSRYCWMKNLGNEEIALGGDGVRIRNPAAVNKLLELAVRAAEERRRVLFFCACEFPRSDEKLSCHRLTIADLLLERANGIGQPLAVVEWPGGEPREMQIIVARKIFTQLIAGARKSIPLHDDQLGEFANLPWGSRAFVQSECDYATATLLVGPARFATSNKGAGVWYLPVLGAPLPQTSEGSLQTIAAAWRKTHCLDVRESL